MPKRNKGEKDMTWYDKNGKKVCGSTTASGYLVEILLKEYGTFHKVLEHINYDEEAKEICNAFIKRGYE